MAHAHNIVDTDTYFLIDDVTKSIVTTAKKTTLVQGTHNSERFTFQIPRFIEDHDMSISDRIEIHYINYSTNTSKFYGDVYIVNDVTVEEDRVLFSWLVSRNATGLVGTLQFSVNFICVDEDNNVVYEWPTDIFKAIKIVERINNTPSISENISDIINSLIDGMFGSTAKIGTVELIAANWTGENNLYSQVVKIEGVTENSQVDLTPSVEQLVVFYEKDLTFVTENDGGIVTVYAIGQRPENDYTVQVTITEVER